MEKEGTSMWQKYNRVLGVVTGLVGLGISIVGAVLARKEDHELLEDEDNEEQEESES